MGVALSGKTQKSVTCSFDATGASSPLLGYTLLINVSIFPKLLINGVFGYGHPGDGNEEKNLVILSMYGSASCRRFTVLLLATPEVL